jgi:hypothetical protein
MKTFTITFIFLLMLAGVSEAQWSFNGTNIYNNNSGNVGIGNSTPATLMHVGKNTTEPTIRVQNFGGAGGATYEMVDNASGADWKFKATNTGGFKIRDHAHGLDAFIIEPNSGANSLYIATGGNVGLGTTTPLYDLDVRGPYAYAQFKAASSWSGIILDKATATDNGYVIHRQGGTDLWTEGTIGNNNFCLFNWVTYSNALTVNLSTNNSRFYGKVGINTEPGYDLDVNSVNYTAADISSPYNGGTVAQIIANGTTSGTWGLYAYATTAGYAAYFSGNVYCTGSYLPSDEKLKENIEPLQNALDKVMQLDTKTYYFKKEFPEMNLPTSKQYGFTAQNIESVFPELVKVNPAKEKEQPTEFKAVNYIGLIPVLTEAIQEQQKQIEAKDLKIDDLQKQLNELKAMVLANQHNN